VAENKDRQIIKSDRPVVSVTGGVMDPTIALKGTPDGHLTIASNTLSFSPDVVRKDQELVIHRKANSSWIFTVREPVKEVTKKRIMTALDQAIATVKDLCRHGNEDIEVGGDFIPAGDLIKNWEELKKELEE
jgi:hypothetical protein